MRTRVLIALVLLLAVPAAGKTRLKKPHRGFQMRIHDFTVKPDEDLEVCQYARLPNRRAIDVNGFELQMPPEAHHFVIWSYGGDVTDDARFPKGPVESVACSGLSPDEAIPQVLIPIQTPDARLRFPDGVALRLDPHKQVWLNPHLKNFTSDTIKPDIRFNFYRAKKGTVRHYAHGLIIGNSGKIAIPAAGDQTLTAEWTAPVPVTLIQLATHQHKLGTYANIEIVAPDGVTRTKIYENTDWQHPRPLWPNPSIRLEKGQKMRITCQWHNPGDHPVYFGPETTDEMCFILGFFYRDDGDTEPVTGGGCLASKDGLLCPLAPAVTE
jgi:Copper type II ascorbate-dependent monooxygenase, C-terminal domain